MPLNHVLEQSEKARSFYNTLHPAVRRIVDEQAGNIEFDGDLYALANNAMSRNLFAYGEIFDDSDSWPD